MADCNDTIDELERFLDKELPNHRVTEIIEHLRMCTDCQGAYEFHAELHRIVSIKATRDEISPEFLDKLRGCLRIEPGDGAR